MKKTYQTPAITLVRLEAMQMLAESGGTSGFANMQGQDDVVFDSRQGGWGNENWGEEE